MKIMIFSIFMACAFVFTGCVGRGGSDKGNVPVIPKPQSVKMYSGYFTIAKDSRVLYDSDLPSVGEIAAELERMIRNAGLSGKGKGRIKLKLDPKKEIQESGYELVIKKRSVQITAAGPAGLFYGMQTLKQLIPDDGSDKVPCLEIIDYPQFGWRGLMLDCSRTFLTKEYLLRYIDRLAEIKMNVLHLHLTDDQGWRIEIKRYPELTEICSRFDSQYPDEINGFYTQDDIREIVAYAARNFITVVPEIEMPGHSREIFAAFPELSCDGKKTVIFPFFKGPGVTEEILCAGNDTVFEFMENVLTEVMELFPSEYIHIGGDEAPKAAWIRCPKCQLRIKTEGLKDEEELQGYFTSRIERFLNSRGRKLIGWDEILEGGLAENAAVMSWRGVKGGIEAALKGHSVVMSPTSHCYFDYSHETTSLEKVYSYFPVPEELTPDQAGFILGAQANMWTHIARTEKTIDDQVFPRLYALAEVVWTGKARGDYKDFLQRMEQFKVRSGK